MNRLLALTAFWLLATVCAFAQDAPVPSKCMAIAGTMPGVHCKGELDALRAGKFELVPPTPAPSWERVEINGHVLRFIPSLSDFDYKCPK